MMPAALLIAALTTSDVTALERGDVTVHVGIVKDNLCCDHESAVFDAHGNRKNLEAPWPSGPAPNWDEIPLYSPRTNAAPMRSGSWVIGAVKSSLFHLLRYDAEGHVVDDDVLPAEPPPHYLTSMGEVEVLSDQCTVAYTMFFNSQEANEMVPPVRHRTLRGYDMCNNRSLDLVVLPEGSATPSNVRQLPNGDLVMTAGREVLRVNRAGNIVKRWPVPAYKFALTPGGDGFWTTMVVCGGPASCPQHLVRFDFAAPPVPVVDIELPGGIIYLTVTGEYRAALQPPASPRRRAASH